MESRTLELALVRLSRPPYDAVLRVLVGFLVVPTWLAVTAVRNTEWTLIAWFLGILAALRLVPAVVRKVIRFSDPVRSEWADRRRLAKRFDSYQWQKLFWIGLGLGLYAFVSGHLIRAQLQLTLVSLVSGALGIVIWLYRTRRPQVTHAVQQGKQSGDEHHGVTPPKMKTRSEA